MPERWLVLRVRGPAAEQEALAEGLFSLGASAIEEEAGGLSTWLPEPADPEGFVRAAQIALEARVAGPVEVQFESRQDEDWLREWRRGLAARVVGPKIVVTPTWIIPEVAAGVHVIVIDPQMAFGTGEHATTRLMLRHLQSVVRPGDRVLDIGTGSGILAIAAAKLGAVHVDAAENDEQAVGNALDNVTRNGVSAAVTVVMEEVTDAWLRSRTAAWDVIVANVLSSVLAPLLAAFRVALRPDGRLLLSGILDSEAAAMRRAAEAVGFVVESEEGEGEWWAVTLSLQG